MAETIIGRNAVLEALKGNREIEKITLAKGAEGSVKQIAAKARDKHIPIYYSDRDLPIQQYFQVERHILL